MALRRVLAQIYRRCERKTGVTMTHAERIAMLPVIRRCDHCRREPRPGYSSCSTCAERKNVYAARKRAEAKALREAAPVCTEITTRALTEEGRALSVARAARWRQNQGSVEWQPRPGSQEFRARKVVKMLEDMLTKWRRDDKRRVNARRANGFGIVLAATVEDGQPASRRS